MKKILSVLLILFALFATAYWAKEKVALGAHAYIYGFPLVLMDTTRKLMLENGLEENQFQHNHAFPDHHFRNVVRPNNNTLYSTAWINLKSEPVVLTVPDMGQRYYVMPLMDPFTNVFASVGSRATGSQAGDYAITAPDWQGQLPPGIKQIKSPNRWLWLIGRIQTNGEADIPAVRQLQTQFSLKPLSRFLSGAADQGELLNQRNVQQDTSQDVDDLSTIEFLSRLGELLQITRTPSEDSRALSRLAKIGVSSKLGFQADQLNFFEQFLVDKGIAIAKQRLDERLAQRDETENGWLVYRSGIGNYANNYPLRAAVAKVGLGALSPQEAAYPNAKEDGQGKALTGQHGYTLNFAADKLPPVDAFWSLAMYNKDGFFVDNPLQRYAIGSRDDLRLNDDGSLTIVIQHQAPSDSKANWLPSPSAEFEVTLRLYLPKQSFLNGEWRLPPIERVN